MLSTRSGIIGMDHNITNDVTDKCYNCGKSFKQLLRHVMNSVCKKKYPADKLKDLKGKSNSTRREKQYSWKKQKHDENIEKSVRKFYCMVCNRPFPEEGILKHLERSKNCKENYPLIPLRKLMIKCKRSVKVKKKVKRKHTYLTKTELQKEEMKHFNVHAKNFKTFFNEIKFGPIYPCVSCNRCLPIRSVRTFEGSSIEWIREKDGKEEEVEVEIDKNLNVQGVCYICTTCKSYLEKKKMPPLCFFNGLALTEVPDCLKIGELGNQLLAKKLIFIKIRPLPKTGMKSVFDRVINIPIPDDDVIKTVTCLPRNPENDGLVNVKLKRKLEYKRVVNEEIVDRKKLIDALEFLQKNHSSYSNITVSEKPNTQNDNSDSDEEDSNEPFETEEKNSVENENPFLVSTCLQPEDPEANIIVNNSSEPLKKKRKLNSNTIYEVAPGENKVWILSFVNFCYMKIIKYLSLLGTN